MFFLPLYSTVLFVPYVHCIQTYNDETRSPGECGPDLPVSHLHPRGDLPYTPGQQPLYQLSYFHRRRNRQKRRQRSSLLFRGRNWRPHEPFSRKNDFKKTLRKTSILGGWWFGVVWTRWSPIFLKHPLCQATVLQFILFFKSSWC